ncbi:MAG: flavin prenyltransferase UbiX [Planctomycetota bacterium]
MLPRDLDILANPTTLISQFMNRSSKRRIVLAITGASGAIYGLRVLEELLRDEMIETHLIISPSAKKVLAIELNLKLNLDRFDPVALKVPKAERVIYHHYADLEAPMASGSYRVDYMAIVPCTMGCAAAIARGLADDLIQRSADVMLKERRPLLIVPRETPLSVIHLENLTALAKLGVLVLPACPGFYGKPRKASELVDFIAARVLDHLQVKHRLGPRWGEGDF